MVNRRGRKEVTDQIIVAAAARSKAARLALEARFVELRGITLVQSQRSVGNPWP